MEVISEQIKVKMDPAPEVLLKAHLIDSKEIITLEVYRGEEIPYYYVGEGNYTAYVRIGNETSYGKSIENTEFFKENGGLDASDYISIHSRKHMYDPDTVSTPKKTQYGKDVNVGKLCEDTIMKPDEVIYNKDQNVMIYKKEYPFNISTSDTPTGTHRVFIPLNTQGKKTIRMSQFPLVGGN